MTSLRLCEIKYLCKFRYFGQVMTDDCYLKQFQQAHQVLQF